MSDELERRLERELRRDRATASVEQRALESALQALPAPAPRRSRRLRAVVAATGAAVVVLGVAAGALATAGALHVTIGEPREHRRQPRPAEVSPQLRVPAGAAAIAAVLDGRLWLATSSGLRIQGLPVSAATLSPHALYVAAGIGNALVAMAPSGSRAWSVPTRGRVVAIAWAPDALRIGYVVRTRGTFELRTIEGSGRNDRLLDARVRPVAPSWRADSLAVAYVGAGGLPVIYDFGHETHHAVHGRALRDATEIAFAPQGSALGVATAHAVTVIARHSAVRVLDAPVGLAWLGNRLAIAVNGPRGDPGAVEELTLGGAGKLEVERRRSLAGPVAAITAGAAHLIVAVHTSPASTRLLSSGGSSAAEDLTQLLSLPTRTTVDELVVR